jgi:hypothetical protein
MPRCLHCAREIGPNARDARDDGRCATCIRDGHRGRSWRECQVCRREEAREIAGGAEGRGAEGDTAPVDPPEDDPARDRHGRRVYDAIPYGASVLRIVATHGRTWRPDGPPAVRLGLAVARGDRRCFEFDAAQARRVAAALLRFAADADGPPAADDHPGR